MPEHDHTNPAQRARDLLYAHCLGVMLADATPTPVRYMIVPATGQLVIDVDQDILDADEHVLMIPEERFDTPLSLLLDLHRTDSEELHDRHRAYHNDAPLPLYALASILSAKLDNSEVIDQEDIQHPNPLASATSRLCRLLNADRHALATICETLTGTYPQTPTAVGVDPHGFHVRARFGVIRARFATECTTESEATSMIESLRNAAHQ